MRDIIPRSFSFALPVLCALLTGPAYAITSQEVRLCVPSPALRTISATSIPTLQAALARALPGDVIVLRNGSYAAANLPVNRSGTTARPVVVKAQTRGGVTFTGARFAFNVTASRVVISGFVFDRSNLLVNGGQGVRIVDNQFKRTPAQAAGVVIAGGASYNRVDHNRFDASAGQGVRLGSLWSGGQDSLFERLAIGNRVDRNHFRNFTGTGNTHEAVMVGMQIPANYGTRVDTLVERNFFENVTIDSETISVKTSGNTISANTFRTGRQNSITIRSGNDNLVTRNVMVGSEGIRVHGRRNRIVENHLQGTSRGIRLMAGNADGTSPSIRDSRGNIVHDAAVDTQVLRNTIVDSKEPGIVSGCLVGSSTGLSCGLTAPQYPRIFETTGAVVTGNIVAMRTSTAVPIRHLRGPLPAYSGNTGWSASGRVGTTAAGIVTGDPHLALVGGLWVATASSPAGAGAPAGLAVMSATTTGPGTADPVCQS